MDLDLPPRVTARAFARLAEINDSAAAPKALRVAVEGGGCSGFQYNIDLDDPADGDLILEAEGQKWSWTRFRCHSCQMPSSIFPKS